MSRAAITNTIELDVRGMHCAGCAASVEAALRKVAHVADASVNLATEQATVKLAARSSAFDPSALVRAVAVAGYQAELREPAVNAIDKRRAARVVELLRQRRRIYLALVFGAPVLALHFGAESLATALGAEPRLNAVLQAALTSVVLIAAAGPMIAGAFRGLLARSANMDLLVTLGALTAFVSGLVGLLLNEPALILFEATVMIVTFVAIGKHFEARARGQASAALEALLARIPRTALRIVADRTETVRVDAVQPGDLLRLPAHTTVPVDGEVVSGRLTIDESLLTGEALPVERTPGDRVFGGTLVADGMADMHATATGRDSAVARIGKLVEQAQAAKPRWQRLADRVAAVFVPVIVLLAVATFVAWSWSSEASTLYALKRMIAVLVVACPCAMGLAIPTAVLVGTTRAAEHGILVRDAAALEAAGQVREVLLDKTGTLTLGQPRLERVELVDAMPRHELLRLTAALEQLSQHPFARAIVDAANETSGELPQPTDFTSQAGSGLRGHVETRDVVVGTAAWLEENGLDTSGHVDQADAIAAHGQSIVWVAVDGHVAALLGLADQLHPESAAAIGDLKQLGVRTRLLSGDRHAAVSNVADTLSIDRFEAQLTPQQKLQRVRQLAGSGPGVAMVGDGINDAPALAAATVGIAIGSGADVARQAADICLVGHSPRLVGEAVRVSRASRRIMQQNLFWAFVYNAVMIPVAMLTAIPPEAATAAMMCSSLSVVANSLRLRRAI